MQQNVVFFTRYVVLPKYEVKYFKQEKNEQTSFKKECKRSWEKLIYMFVSLQHNYRGSTH